MLSEAQRKFLHLLDTRAGSSSISERSYADGGGIALRSVPQPNEELAVISRDEWNAFKKRGYVGHYGLTQAGRQALESDHDT